MGPRAKGQPLNVFTATDDITDLSVEHDRDNRGLGQVRPRGARDGGDDWKGRSGMRGGDGRRREDSDANPEIDEGNWRNPRPASSTNRSAAGGYGGGYGSTGGYGGTGGFGGGGFASGSMRESRETREQSDFVRAAPSAPRKIQFGSIAGFVQSANADTADALEQAKKAAAAQPPPTSSVEIASAKGGRFSGLGESGSSDRNRPPLRPKMEHSGYPEKRYLGTSERGGFDRSFDKGPRMPEPTHKAAGYTPDKLKREADYAQQARKVALEQRLLMEKAKKDAEMAEERKREQELAREAAAEAKREAALAEQKATAAAQERRAYEKKLFAGQLLVGSTADIRALVNGLSDVYEGAEAEKAMQAVLTSTPTLRESTLPLAIIFALFIRKVLDACEDAADEIGPVAPEEGEEAAMEEVVKAQVVPMVDKNCDACKRLLLAFGEASILEKEDLKLAQLQELARVVASCGLGRMTPESHLVEMVYEALLRNEVISSEEFLEWFSHPHDHAEKRTDALTRVVRIARGLKGLDEPPVGETGQDDEGESVDEDD